MSQVNVESITPFSEPAILNSTAFGHEVKYKVTIAYKPCPKEGAASMQYIENTDRVPPFLEKLGMKPNEDFDTYGAMRNADQTPDGFGSWAYRNEGKSMPCSGSKTIPITDKPTLGGPAGISVSRTLKARIVFTNPNGCPSGTVSAGWTQDLGWNGNQITFQQLNPD